jgi:hypothetical protein
MREGKLPKWLYAMPWWVGVGVVDLARGKKVAASSGESPENAVDGDYFSVWSSAKSDDEWIYVDLGRVARIDRIVPSKQQSRT